MSADGSGRTRPLPWLEKGGVPSITFCPVVVECEIEPTADSGSDPDDTSQKLAQSQAQRDTSPDVSQASLSQFTAENASRLQRSWGSATGSC